MRGKSSNEAWAAKETVAELCERRGLDINHLTVTSCDADTLFPPQYFECLTYHFATDPRRYRRFWQAPIFFYNNIWQVPAPLRVPNALAGLVHLCRLSRRRKVLFSQSTYTLSMRMAHDVGYWDTDIIPEDWHMFLKCFYNLGGNDPVKLTTLIEEIEKALGMKATIERKPAQPGDVERTYADLARSTAELGYRPRTSLREGLRKFAQWFRDNAQRYRHNVER